MKALALLLIAVPVLAADPSVTSTRSGPFDYQAQRSDGTTSNHTRPEIAAFACANWLFQNPAGTCAVQGGKWNITVTVTPPLAGVTATITWTAPTKNTDGTNFTDPAGYKVYHGTSPTALTDIKQVTGTSYQFTGLASGTHYFAVSVLNQSGVESVMTGPATKVVP